MRSSRLRMSVPLPTPEGPVMTKTFPPIPPILRSDVRGGAEGMSRLQLATQHRDQLGALALRETSNGLGRRDAAHLQDLVDLHAAVLGYGEQHVEDLGGLDVFGRLEEQHVDAGPAGLQVALERGTLGSDLVRALERLHALDEGTLRSSRGGLGGRLRRWRHGR